MPSGRSGGSSCRWGKRPIADITVRRQGRPPGSGRPRRAVSSANLLVHIRSLFNWAASKRDYGLDHSPCDRLKPKTVIGKKAVRTRILTDDELRVWRATRRLGYPYGPLFRLLALTGQRKSEVAEARWSEFDLTIKCGSSPLSE